jgi:hypothetical protein
MINWYNEVSRSLAKIPDCVAYFEKELQEAKKQCKIYGNLERASAALPGIELRRLRSKTFKKFLENYNRALSSRDAEKYVDGEDDVVDMTKIVNDFALIRNQYLGITKGLDQKQWQITNIVKLRVAGMEDADIK